MKLLEVVWNYFTTPVPYSPLEMMIWSIIALLAIYFYRSWQYDRSKIHEDRTDNIKPEIKWVVIVRHLPDMILADRVDVDLSATAFITLDTYKTILDHWEVVSSFKASVFNVKSGRWTCIDISLEHMAYDSIHVIQYWSHDYCDYVGNYSDYVSCNSASTRLVTKSECNQLPDTLRTIIETSRTRLQNAAKEKFGCAYNGDKPIIKESLRFDSFTKCIYCFDITYT